MGRPQTKTIRHPFYWLMRVESYAREIKHLQIKMAKVERYALETGAKPVDIEIACTKGESL